MWIELHLLQNFAPSNLNRDDTGSPKDCEFGGYRRARISSQCQKKAIRDAFRERNLLPCDNLGVRSARVVEDIGRRLVAAGHPADDAERVAASALHEIGFGLKDGRTDYLLFLGADELAALAEACAAHWEALAAAGSDGKRRAKKGGEALSKEARATLAAALDGRRAADVALFGRMLADLPRHNREGACWVAHAISTNAMELEFDYFTAVDDLKGPQDDAGAGMIGNVEFTSACFYRYAAIDLRELGSNLGGDEALVGATVRAFVEAAATAIPTGKQHSFAAHNLPSLLLLAIRTGAPRSLANAFVRPVAPSAGQDLIGGSIGALDAYWSRLNAMYGDGGLVATAVLVDDHYAGDLADLGAARVPSLAAIIERAADETFASATL